MNSVARRFDRAADSYDTHAEVQRELGESLLALYRRERSPRHILELGCGTGWFSRKLGERFPQAEFWITDAAPRMVEKAARSWPAQGPRAQFGLLDAEVLPAWTDDPRVDRPQGMPKTFDLIASNAMVQWFPDLGAHLRSVREVLRPGGDLLISGFTPENLGELRAALKRMGRPETRGLGHGAESVQKTVEDEGLILKGWQAQEMRRVYASPEALLRGLAALGATGPRAEATGESDGGWAAPSHRPLLRGELQKLVATYRMLALAPGGGVTATWSTWAAWILRP